MMEGVKVVVVVGGGYLGIASLFELWASGEEGKLFGGHDRGFHVLRHGIAGSGCIYIIYLHAYNLFEF